MKPIAVAAASRGAGLIDVFTQGPDTAMFYQMFDTAWDPEWLALDGVFNYPPAAVALGPTRTDVFAIGTDYAMFHKFGESDNWTPSISTWESLGGVFDSPPAVVSTGPNLIDVFGIGGTKEVFQKSFDGRGPGRIDLFAVGTNQIMFHKFFDNGQWHPSQTGWESLGGSFTSPPAAVSWGPNRLDVFAVGTNLDILHRAFDTSGWRPWDTLGGTFNSQPAVVSWAANRLDVFGLGTNGSIFHKFWNAGWSSTWEDLGGKMGSAPAAVVWGPEQLHLFAVTTDRRLFHKEMNSAGWTPGETTWDSLGGVFVDPPAPPLPGLVGGLGSNSNYNFTNNCGPLLGVSAIIDITEDIVCQSTMGQNSNLGFSFQLNAYSPPGSACAFQQYTISLLNNELTGGINNWAADNNGSPLFGDFPGLVSMPEPKLPAGFILKILLENDDKGNVTGVRWIVIDNLGHELMNKQETTFMAGGNAAQLAPIIAFEVDFVGPNGGDSAVLTSGAGTITYKASSMMTPTGNQFPCGVPILGTAEMANTFYGFLPNISNTQFTQSFRVETDQPTINKPGKHLPPTPGP